MDIGTIILGASAIIGMIAGVVQVIDFFQNQRKQKRFKESSKFDTPSANILDTNAPRIDLQNTPEYSSQKTGVYHNLPPRNEFVGRQDEIERVHQALLSRPHIISIDGIGGVGKTSLALEISHECLKISNGEKSDEQIATFKGFIWITSKGHELTLDGVLDEIAQTLNHVVVMKQSLKEKRKSIIQILQSTPSLLIVDSYETITDNTIYDFLLEIPEPSKVIITTRTQKINQAKSIPLKGLPDLDALNLIRSHGSSLGLKEIEQANDSKLLRLCKSTGGHPLATKWALGQIKQKGQSLSTTLEFLEKAQGNIFDQIFLNSWKLLSQDAQRILRIMPIFTTDAIKQSIEVASRLFGDAFDTAMGQLIEMSLIHPTEIQNKSNQRYSTHPLTRAFALSQLESDTKIAYYAKKDLAGFFEEYTREHGGLWNLDGFEIIKSDIANIISIIKWCTQEQLFELSASLIDNIRYFLINYGLWNTALEVALDAVKLFPFESKKNTKRLKEWQTKTALLRLWPIAWIYRFRGNFEAAKREISLVLDLFKQDGDEYNVAYAKRHLSLVVQQLGEMENAEKLLIEAREFSFSIQDEEERKYRTQLLTADLSVLALKRGDLDSAWNLSSTVFEISSQILSDSDNHNYQNLQTIATFYRVLGSVARQRGNFEQAKTLCEKALKYTEKLEYRDGIADASFELAQIELEMGQIQEALQRFESARLIYQALGMEQKIQEIEKALSKLSEYNNANQ